jgi:glutamyl-Q tRNA(Asp) synthetase
LLILPAPTYHHHDLILDETGQKLSKSRNARSLRDLRLEGCSPADFYRQLGLAQV